MEQNATPEAMCLQHERGQQILEQRSTSSSLLDGESDLCKSQGPEIAKQRHPKRGNRGFVAGGSCRAVGSTSPSCVASPRRCRAPSIQTQRVAAVPNRLAVRSPAAQPHVETHNLRCSSVVDVSTHVVTVASYFAIHLPPSGRTDSSVGVR
jgi:hypothetical protein